MTEGSRVADLQIRSLFLSLFSLLFSVCSSSPMSPSIARVSMGDFVLSFLSFPFLALSFFSTFLTLVRVDSAVAGLGSRIINKYINK